MSTSPDSLSARLDVTTEHIRGRIGARRPAVGLILGSGLGAYADSLHAPIAIDYADIPGFPRSTVAGHAGRLVVGEKSGVTCVAMQGRIHFYEGHTAAQVAFPARVLVALGAQTLIITNAAGGLAHEPGTLMVLRDHINLMPDHPLRGDNDPQVGTRFPDMSAAYDPELRAIARTVGDRVGATMAEGVYAALPGPSYETPAEVRMLGILGADAAGMSTVPEVIAARHMGARVLGISCITNKAAGLSDHPLSHDEVTETATRVRATFIELLDGILAELGGAR